MGSWRMDDRIWKRRHDTLDRIGNRSITIGGPVMLKVMNHGEYQRRLRSKSVSELLWIIKDAGAAAAAMPDSPNNGFY